jgi:hypothetical protein
LAKKLGKPQNFVSKVDRGEQRLHFTEFIELGDTLGVDFIDLSQECRR